jgi:DNA-binding NtrC family response regulator
MVSADPNIKVHTLLLVTRPVSDPHAILPLIAQKDRSILVAEDVIRIQDLCQTHPEIELVMISMELAVEYGMATIEKTHMLIPEVPIVVISKYVTLETIRLATMMGCDEIIQSPVDRSTLNAVIEKYLPGN